MNAPVKFEWLNLRKAIETEPAPLDFVLPGMLAGTVGALVSAGGAGKTMAALELSVLISGGHDILGITSPGAPLPTGKVTFLTAEDPGLVLDHRIHAIGARLPASARDSIYERLSIAPLVGTGVDIDNPSWWSWICHEAQDSRLVVIDTLRKFHKRDENDGGAMSGLLSMFEALCRDTGTTILFLHHASKAGALSGGDTQQASRGSSVLTDNVRWQANLFGMSRADAIKAKLTTVEARRRVCFAVVKPNYGPPIADHWLRREVGGVLAPLPTSAQAAAEIHKQASQSSGVRNDWK